MGRLQIVAPLAGWNVRGWSYGERQDDGQLHPGLDLNVGGGDEDLGLDVVAMADGTVVEVVEWDGRSYGFGNGVLVEHDLGIGDVTDFRLWGLYGHLDAFDDAVYVGERVEAGQRLGGCGKSGRQRWAHVHFEVRFFGPEEGMPARYWGGGLAIDELNRRYADPYTVLKMGELLAAIGAGTGADCSELQADRDNNYALKMAFEAYLRSLEGRRRYVKAGTVARLIASV